MTGDEREIRSRSGMALIRSGRWFTAADVGHRLGLDMAAPGRRLAHIMARLCKEGDLIVRKASERGHTATYRWARCRECNAKLELEVGNENAVRCPVCAEAHARHVQA